MAAVRRLALLSALALIALCLAAPASSIRVTGVIFATIGPGPYLLVETSRGVRFKTLKPGLYAFNVRDLSDRRNFHLRGPGVNRASSVKGVKGGTVWRVVLRKGTYEYYSDGFRRTLRGTFKVV